MASKLKRNAVITGCVNSFCLACQCFLKSEMEANKHIEMIEHLENLRSSPYFEKYENDHIRKVKKGYFCEFCNFLMSTASKVTSHVTGIQHKKNKGNQLLKPLANGDVASGEVIIIEKAWHSLVDSTCAICNIEFEDEDVHKNDTTHLLNLVLSQVHFGEYNGIYRKIDDNYFQCLTCNTMYALTTITEHFTDPEHEKLYNNCQFVEKQNDNNNPQEYFKKNQTTDAVNAANDTSFGANSDDTNKIQTVNPIKINKSTKAVNPNVGLGAKLVENEGNNKTQTVTSEDQNKADILDSIIRYQKKEINVNFEAETVFCKKCFKHLKFLAEDIDNHIDEHTKNPINIEPSTSYPSNIDQKYSKTIFAKPLSDKEHTVISEVDQNDNEITEDSQNKQNKEELRARKDSGKCVTKVKAGSSEVPINNEEIPEASAQTPEINDPSTFAKQNKITYNFGYNNAFCRICETKMPSTLRSMKEHVSGKEHKNKVARLSKKPKFLKKPMEKFLKSLLTVENLFHCSTVINEKFYVDRLSFQMIIENDTRLRCHVCEVNLPDGADDHIKFRSHTSALLDTPIITSLPTEFVREVRPGIFHCGYCNLILPNWSDLENHLKSLDHMYKKDICNFRLNQFLPELIEWKKIQDFRMIMNSLLGHHVF